jgi:hypothetical protein
MCAPPYSPLRKQPPPPICKSHASPLRSDRSSKEWVPEYLLRRNEVLSTVVDGKHCGAVNATHFYP